MAVIDQLQTDEYAIYNGDSCEVLPLLPAKSIHMSIYSPPFAVDGPRGGGGCLYHYSSSERDLSNCQSYDDFFDHYEFIVREIARITLPGRISAVHCCDVPMDGANICGYADFPGRIIQLHQKHGFDYLPRIVIPKEPLTVRNRTMTKALAHRQICDDSTLTNVAAADYLLPFRKKGNNPVPVSHPVGLTSYAGFRQPPHELNHYRGWRGDQKQNRYSHWIWRRYASSVWEDIRGNGWERVKAEGVRGSGVLPFEGGKEEEDERHVHPLQLDVIERAVVLWSNPGETVLTPFMGVGSECYGAVLNGRKAIGIELKPSYYRQAVRNLDSVQRVEDPMLIGMNTDEQCHD